MYSKLHTINLSAVQGFKRGGVRVEVMVMTALGNGMGRSAARSRQMSQEPAGPDRNVGYQAGGEKPSTNIRRAWRPEPTGWDWSPASEA